MTHDWRDFLRAGDILLSRNGTPRIVRRVHYKKNGFLFGVSLVIQRRSWTNRCYTILCRSDLAGRGYRKTDGRYHFRAGGIDLQIDNEIKNSYLPTGIKLHANDVRGIP